MERKILRVGEPGSELLFRRSALVPEELFGSDELARLAHDLRETRGKGTGISAVQIGVPWDVYVTKYGENDEERVWVNARVVEQSAEQVVLHEGCLSFNDDIGVVGSQGRYFGPVRAPCEGVIQGRDVDGRLCQVTCNGGLFRTHWHEIRHTQGRMFYEDMTSGAMVVGLLPFRWLVKPNEAWETSMNEFQYVDEGL